ncbi:2OG-Fe(II) oxygenase [Rhizobium ruizarguesonis]
MDWMSCAEVLTDEECDRIISACRQFELVPPIVVGEDRLPGHRRADSRMLGVTEDTAWFFEYLLSIAEQATEKAYLLSLSGITRPPQYVEYRDGWGEFGWHNDYSHGLPDAPRKLTIIFQLSEPSDYEGGLLQVMSNDIETAPRKRGSIIVFPSILMHRVTPVTAGLRRALVAWIAGPRHE